MGAPPVTDDDDPQSGDEAATYLAPEKRAQLIPTWIVTRDDLHRSERANSAGGLRWPSNLKYPTSVLSSQHDYIIKR
jgi:hypothetical protein